MRTWTTGSVGKLDLDDLVIPIVDRRGPAYTGMTCRTGGMLLLPVDHKPTHIEAALDMGLPADILACGPPELHAVIALARREQLRIEIARINDMAAREEIVFFGGG